VIKPKKKRLDVLLFEKALVESRSQAQALILAGKVLVNDERIDKPGHAVADDAIIRLKDIPRYVSRGGLKLEKALQIFPLNIANATALDIGASTGGFTDCLLQHGAKKVYAIDVGVGQLHWKLTTDKRVVVFEKTNFRHMDISHINDPIDVCVMDVSFISIEKLLPVLLAVFKKHHHKVQNVFLIKPQFETSPENVGKGGIVKDVTVREQVVEKIKTALMNHDLQDIQITPSPILGADGNEEFLIFSQYIPSQEKNKL